MSLPARAAVSQPASAPASKRPVRTANVVVVLLIVVVLQVGGVPSTLPGPVSGPRQAWALCRSHRLARGRPGGNGAV